MWSSDFPFSQISAPPTHLFARRLTPRPAQRFKRVENPGQALFPRATAFETGFDRGLRQGGGGAGQHLGNGADLVGKRAWPGLSGLIAGGDG